jgi:protein phosphatase 1 regulatory subunit 7
VTATHSVLDLSFNLLRRIPSEALATMSSLKTLYLIQNKISRIEGLHTIAATLTSLELGGNKLRVRSGDGDDAADR